MFNIEENYISSEKERINSINAAEKARRFIGGTLALTFLIMLIVRLISG